MTLTELKYIVALAQERHFGRAAQASFVSQPTLSVAVKKLEDELGVTLFERGTSEIIPTPIGERIVAQAQKVLEEVGEIQTLAQAAQDPLSDPLRMGAIYTVGPYLLPYLVPRLRERAPQMSLIVEEDYTSNLASRLRQGKLDFILVSLPFDVPYLLTGPLYEEPFVVVFPASHSWAQRDAIDVNELGEETVLLLNDGHCFRDQVLESCPQCRPTSRAAEGMQRTLESSSLETIRYMVASGLGVTVMPCTAVGGDLYSQRLLRARPFAGQPPKRQIALAWRESFPRRQALQVVSQAVCDCPLDCVRLFNSDYLSNL